MFELPYLLLVYFEVRGSDEELLVIGASDVVKDVIKRVGNHASLGWVIADTFTDVTVM